MCVQFVNPGIFSFLMSFNVEDFTLEITVWTTVLEYSLSRFFTHADFLLDKDQFRDSELQRRHSVKFFKITGFEPQKI